MQFPLWYLSPRDVRVLSLVFILFYISPAELSSGICLSSQFEIELEKMLEMVRNIWSRMRTKDSHGIQIGISSFLTFERSHGGRPRWKMKSWEFCQLVKLVLVTGGTGRGQWRLELISYLSWLSTWQSSDHNGPGKNLHTPHWSLSLSLSQVYNPDFRF